MHTDLATKLKYSILVEYTYWGMLPLKKIAMRHETYLLGGVEIVSFVMIKKTKNILDCITMVMVSIG